MKLKQTIYQIFFVNNLLSRANYASFVGLRNDLFPNKSGEGY